MSPPSEPEVGDAPPFRSLASYARLWSSVGARLGVGAALGLWLGDVAALGSSRAAAGGPAWDVGMGAALFVAMTASIPVGAALGLMIGPSSREAIAAARSLGDRLRHGSPDAQRELVARSLALAALAPVSALVVYRAVLALDFWLARPESLAAAVAVAHLTLAPLLMLAWPAGLRAGRALVGRAATVPVARWFVARASRVASLVALAGFASAVAVTVARWRVLRSLQWSAALPASGLALGLVGAVWVTSSRSPRLRRAALGLALLALAGGAVAASRVRSDMTAARRFARELAWSGRLGGIAWEAALDFDRDGQIGVIGGGDCAPFDRRRYTGAVEIPGNGVDEDCDGQDLVARTLAPRARVRLGPGATPAQPTIVLVTIDALAAQRITAPGPKPVMPKLLSFAERAASFTRCFAEGPSTRLSFPSMFTSRWDSQLERTFKPRPPYPLTTAERQIQDVLDGAGYLTVAVVPDSYFLPPSWPSVARGFQRVDSSATSVSKNNAPQVTDAAIRALEAPRDRPLYLWVHYYDAHGPYTRPPGVTTVGNSDDALYDAELSFLDVQVARLLSAIEARPEPSYVFVTADHGTVFHPHPATRRGRYGYDLFTATLHVPLLVRGPGITARQVTGLASTMDIAPTIADLTRVESPPQYEGTSLVPELFFNASNADRVLFHEFYLAENDYRGEDPLGLVSARQGRWNLILDRRRGSYQLYDWTADYFEERDLFSQRSTSPETMRLRSLLSVFVQQYHRRPVGSVRYAEPQGPN